MNIKAANVAEFLREFKSIVTSGRGLDLIPRAETNQTILNLGLTSRQCEEIILSLSVNNYCDGPLPDYDYPGSLWIFGVLLNDCEIYIKLKIANVNGIKLAKCISFHESELPLKYLCK